MTRSRACLNRYREKEREKTKGEHTLQLSGGREKGGTHAP